ncbi:MAG: iron-containing alcohol dehydrogenase [Verrucomicrobiales bacterium]|nr:iron-containing alcohol dehydrogenase [Verrucomicrobiales bacterium]
MAASASANPESPGAPRLPAHWAFGPADCQLRTRIVFGCGTVRRLGELAAEWARSRVLLVTDPGIVQAGHAARVSAILEEGGRKVTVFDQVRENPDTECVEACLAVARAIDPELIVGLGGGSSMDTAKGCNFLHTNGGRMRDYWGVGKATRPMLPFIAIPTTAGTGSECQSAALIADAQSHAKMACLDPKAAARIALLDPELTVTQPPRVTACTGIDAVAHAVETAVTAKRTPLSSMFSREAFRLLAPTLPVVLKSPTDLDARGRMLLGAALAGTAIELSMLGAAHAAANPLTAHFNVVHGLAVGLMLPHVVRFNARDARVADAYAELMRGTGWAEAANDAGELSELLAARLSQLVLGCGLTPNLEAAGVRAEALPTLAAEAAGQWTAGFNPRPIAAPEFEQLYRQAMV